ncbi:unnamed protein product [Polarella glacialis]|uniref:RING-type domain-containing protein n=1 Tax=Polarella glacialis TaxID=89957 RepID=A0A813HU81_POLGL|nr:unnamed protein product [Polarella glacialis]CAE8652625.1 unnamed protein product [Polarella glacialis]
MQFAPLPREHILPAGGGVRTWCCPCDLCQQRLQEVADQFLLPFSLTIGLFALLTFGLACCELVRLLGPVPYGFIAALISGLIGTMPCWLGLLCGGSTGFRHLASTESVGFRHLASTESVGAEPLAEKAQQKLCQLLVLQVADQAPCAICLMGVELDDPYHLLPCGHGFHSECIAQWWFHSRGGAAGCPVCRRPLPEGVWPRVRRLQE